jgi:hypothetical protein
MSIQSVMMCQSKSAPSAPRRSCKSQAVMIAAFAPLDPKPTTFAQHETQQTAKAAGGGIDSRKPCRKGRELKEGEMDGVNLHTNKVDFGLRERYGFHHADKTLLVRDYLSAWPHASCRAAQLPSEQPANPASKCRRCGCGKVSF